MAIKSFKPYTPSRRNMTVSAFDGVDKKAKPERSLLETVKKNAGRNSYGRITVRHRGGGNKRKYRIIDFRRDKLDMPATVQRIEYDPNRSAFIALVKYEDGELRYILAPVGLKTGDTVVLDFEGFVDGKPFDGGKAEGYTLTLGSGAFIPGFEDQLVGLKAGDEKDVVVTFPENYTKELAGKEATFKCKIHEVKETIKPELDDEFAKDVSEYDTLAALKKSIKADLAAKRQEAVDRDFENEAVVLAGKNMTCDIPACMIDEQVDKHLEQFAYQLQSQGMKMDDYLKMIGGDVKGMRDSMRPMAEQTVRSNILLSEIVHQENLDVTEEEVEEELKKMAEQYKMELDKIKEMVDVEAVKSDLKGRKAVKLIVDNAKPVEKEKKTAKKAAKKEDAAEAPAEEAKTEE